VVAWRLAASALRHDAGDWRGGAAARAAGEQPSALRRWSLETWRGQRRAGGAATCAAGERAVALELERRCGRAVQDGGRTAGAKRQLELGLGLGTIMGLYSSSGPQLPTGAAGWRSAPGHIV
jgi:hypothetical protein